MLRTFVSPTDGPGHHAALREPLRPPSVVPEAGYLSLLMHTSS